MTSTPCVTHRTMAVRDAVGRYHATRAAYDRAEDRQSGLCRGENPLTVCAVEIDVDLATEAMDNAEAELARLILGCGGRAVRVDGTIYVAVHADADHPDQAIVAVLDEDELILVV